MGTSNPVEQCANRRVVVDHAREDWIRRLTDLSRRNNLLYFRELKTGSLDLSDADPKAMFAFLQGEGVPVSRLLPGSDQVGTAARLQEIRRRAQANRDEKGLETLFLVMGTATWQPADKGRPAEAAILLVPTGIEVRGREGRSLALRRKGEIQVNLVLLQVLQADHGAFVSPESLLEILQADDEGELFDPRPVYARLADAAKGLEGFAVKHRLVLGNFAFQKTAMVRDLREFGDEMARHELIAAIAGDGEARQIVQGRRTEIDPCEIDRTPPESEFLVLDADCSQQRVILGALAGQDGVIQGPPGTGKSQTIANLIVESAARGRRVLFVAEKRAALEVVLKRLEKAGLGHLALDLHGAEISRKDVMSRIADSLAIVREIPPVDSEQKHRHLVDRRRRLNEHVARLHSNRAPSGMSVYELHGRLIQLSARVQSSTRWRGAELDRLDRRTKESVCDLLIEAGGFGGLFIRNDPSPWTGASLADGESVQEAMDLVARLSARWRGLESSLDRVVAESRLTRPQSLEDVRVLLELLSDVAQTIATYSEDLFSQEDVDALAAALAPAGRGMIARLWALMANETFRRAMRTVKALRRSKRARPSQILEEVQAAADQRRRWRRLSPRGACPACVNTVADIRNEVQILQRDLARIGAKLGRDDLWRLEFENLRKALDGLASDSTTPYRLPRVIEIEREIDSLGAGAIALELRASSPPPDIWPSVFEHAWFSSCLDRARSEDPALAAFNGRTHDSFVEEFRRLDSEHVAITAGRVKRAHAERVVAAMNAHPEQEDIVRHEAAKKARHMPLRKLLAEAPQVLTALRPCWMASPLSVSQLLPADRQLFDIVLLDEASQVLPEDAVPSLLRGTHAVVAGDRHQLPPTSFFLVGEEEELESETAAPTQGFESILDVLSGFLQPWPLDWHYRSRDEALIAFSNRHIYNHRLVTFPGPGGEPAIEHVLAEHVPDQDGQEESSSTEVRKVVDLVLRHATERPRESLGVITLGIPHARRVDAAIQEARRQRPELDTFFDESRQERFFVKNLERVQGDERDAIILAIGYGKDRSGRLLYRFGPMVSQGGERRLNVAITRARTRLTLVSSFSHRDMDPGRSKSRGVELLRLYLEYAESGGRRLGQTSTGEFRLNDFEQDVHDALTAKGIPLLPQWGASRYRIDFVAQHPMYRGRFVLAIECDGATYHSAHTARDRDRLRQQHLEALGWRFHRIWSTDWFLRREEEVTRAVAAYHAAVAKANREDESGIDSGRESPGVNLRDPQEAPVSWPERSYWPSISRRPSIDDYSLAELVTLVKWIQSDERLRTDDEILEETVEALGFERRGSRIEATLRQAIEVWRERQREPEDRAA